MITNWIAILALVAAMNTTQPVQPTPVGDEPVKGTTYCLNQPVDWAHLPEQDNCPLTSTKDQWMPRP